MAALLNTQSEISTIWQLIRGELEKLSFLIYPRRVLLPQQQHFSKITSK